uniref:Uncharacterized protein n=1 Tax=Eutreptiella gymnastica TaxID=73025 RepID=A0A7S1J5U1_9EUGL
MWLHCVGRVHLHPCLAQSHMCQLCQWLEPKIQPKGAHTPPHQQLWGFAKNKRFMPLIKTPCQRLQPVICSCGSHGRSHDPGPHTPQGKLLDRAGSVPLPSP